MHADRLIRRRRAVLGIAAVALIAATATPALGAAKTTKKSTKTTSRAKTTTKTTAKTAASAPASTAVTTPASSTPASTALARKSTIVIGTPVGVTGPSAGTQVSVTYVGAAWEAWVNANGGINGHPVKVVFNDVKGDPATASSVAKEMVEKDKIIAAVGATDSGTETVYQKVFTDAKVPVIGGTCYSSGVTCGRVPGIFNVSTSVPAIVQVQVVSAKAVGAKRFGVASCAEIAACSAAEPLYRPTAEALGLTYGGLVKVAGAAPDYTAECLTLKNAGVDFVQLSASATVGARLARDCDRQGYSPTFGASGGTAAEAELGPVSKGGYTFAGGLQGFPWWVDDAPVKQYREVMDKYAKGKDTSNPTSTAAWASYELFRKAMARASDNPTSQEVFEAIYALRDEDLGGLLPQKMTYPKDQPSPLISCFYLYRLDLGKFTAVDGGLKPSCFPARS